MRESIQRETEGHIENNYHVGGLTDKKLIQGWKRGKAHRFTTQIKISFPEFLDRWSNSNPNLHGGQELFLVQINRRLTNRVVISKTKLFHKVKTQNTL